MLYREEHPEARKSDCARELGISYNTVLKHWDEYSMNVSLKPREAVVSWRRSNPDGNKSACIRDTGLSFKTVAKYWNCEDVGKDGF